MFTDHHTSTHLEERTRRLEQELDELALIVLEREEIEAVADDLAQAGLL